MMNVIDIIQTRRNIKKFKKDQIERCTILSWLQAATFAPNHRMTEPWEVYFIGPETRAKLNHKSNFGNAPVIFAVLSKHGKNEIEREENRAATACFIQNFMLSAWAEGVGSFWSSIGISPTNRVILSVPDDYDVIGVIGLGYPEEIPVIKTRTLIDEKIKELP